MSKETKKAALLDKAAMKEKAVKYCQANPNVKEVYVSADGSLFPKAYFAAQHATTLEDKEVVHYKAPASTFSRVVTEKTTGIPYQLTDDEKELLAKGLDVKNYQAIKALVAKLEIKTTDNKAETLIEALKSHPVYSV